MAKVVIPLAILAALIGSLAAWGSYEQHHPRAANDDVATRQPPPGARQIELAEPGPAKSDESPVDGAPPVCGGFSDRRVCEMHMDGAACTDCTQAADGPAPTCVSCHSPEAPFPLSRPLQESSER